MVDLKEEILGVLTPIFGEGLKEQLTKNYDSNNPQEVIDVSHKMLSDYLGEDAADELLKKIIKKFPELKLRLD